eukprot:TRINITY_DN1375_c0_g1_i1.p2 TRINITY_DN1375_c0_g1~~TRINITY_DN1375_c0_g1_i1.p2  ORF type:complete len:304 (+),score=114.69 TRINITY_DN1375_c0_g1_i1:2078-2989(+)
MYNGVGVSTPRGTGTNGYVCTNLANPPKARKMAKSREDDWKMVKMKTKPQQKKPNEEILEHDKKRSIELKVTQWAEDNGYLDSDMPQEELEAIMEEARQRFIKEEEDVDKRKSNRSKSKNLIEDLRDAKDRVLSTHEEAKLRQQRQSVIAEAFGMKEDKYNEGDAFDKELQEKKKQDKLKELLKKEKDRLKTERRAEREERRKQREERRSKRDKDEKDSSSESSSSSDEEEEREDKKKEQDSTKEKAVQPERLRDRDRAHDREDSRRSDDRVKSSTNKRNRDERSSSSDSEEESRRSKKERRS